MNVGIIAALIIMFISVSLALIVVSVYLITLILEDKRYFIPIVDKRCNDDVKCNRAPGE